MINLVKIDHLKDVLDTVALKSIYFDEERIVVESELKTCNLCK